MKSATMNETVTDIKIAVKAKSGKRAKSGHPWIFSNEIQHPQPLPEAGAIVTVVDDQGRFLGYAGYNPHSLITLRLLSRNLQEVPGSSAWFQKKFEQAYTLRKRLYPQRRSYRLLYADSDLLPGIIVDKYEEVLTVQILTAVMEKHIDAIIEALAQTIHPKAIVLRNQNEMRSMEGLPLYNKVLLGDVQDMVEIDECGVRIAVDVLSGQKTGHFFDQVENREALCHWAAGGRVLDLFCHTAAWSLHLLKSGATHAVAVDSAEPAIRLAKRNAALNQVEDRLECVQADAFSWLSHARQEEKFFNVVVTDPPAFAKSAKQVSGALRGYEDLNRQAIHLLREGGILCACSCSYHISENEFLDCLHRAAARERRHIQVLDIRGQAADHPVLLSMPESRYLKCIIGLVKEY